MSEGLRNWIWLALLAVVVGVAGFTSPAWQSLVGGWSGHTRSFGSPPVEVQLEADSSNGAPTQRAPANEREDAAPKFAGSVSDTDAAFFQEDGEQYLKGRVAIVRNGHSLTVEIDDANGQPIKSADGGTVRRHVRLKGIIAPGPGEAFGDAAKEMLASMVLDRRVEVRWNARNKKGWPLGEVLVDGCWVNARMVHHGLAVHSTRNSDNARLAAAQEFARANQLGCWIVDDAGSDDAAQESAPRVYWLNTASLIRHNGACHYYNNCKGRPCNATEGKPCGKCGG